MTSEVKILKDQLRHAGSNDFLFFLWGLYQFWLGNITLARTAIEIDSSIVAMRTQGKQGRFLIPPWELVGLLNLYLEAYDNLTDSPLKPKKLLTRKWRVVEELVNRYRRIVNHHSMDGVAGNGDALLEMIPRLMWQQFTWQRRHDAPRYIIRNTYINYVDEARNVFKQRYNLDAEKFFTISILLTIHFKRSPYFDDFNKYSEIGVTSKEMRRYFNIVSKTVKQASKDSNGWNKPDDRNLEFRRSMIFDFPVFKLADDLQPVYMCPFPELLAYRATYFLYFDIMGAMGKSSNKALSKAAASAKAAMDKQYENYCIEIAQQYLSDSLLCEGDFTYGSSGFQRHTPDLLVRTGNVISMVAECKSKKMKIKIRLSPRPVTDYKDEINDLAKGILQIWKFYRDLLAGRVIKDGTPYQAADDFVGALITLEEWPDHNPIFMRKCFSIADALNERAKGTESYVSANHQVPVCLLSVDEYENILRDVRPECLPEYLRDFSSYQGNITEEGFSRLELMKDEPEQKHPLANHIHEIIPLTPALYEMGALRNKV